MTFPQSLRAFSINTAPTLRRSIPLLPLRTAEDWLAGRRTPPEWVQGLVLNHLRSKTTEGASGHD